MSKIRPVTLKDMGQMLGISYSTVSRALKGHPDVNEETIAAVQKLAKELHYKPHATAVSLRNRESKIIGLILPKIFYYYVPSVINAVEEELHKHGYKLMLFQSNESLLREKECIEIFLLNNIDGILASVSKETDNYDHFVEVQQLGIPLVFFDRVPDDFAADKIVVDEVKGTYNGVSYLISTGCKRIALVLDNPKLSITGNRRKGYAFALEDHHLPYDESLVVYGETSEGVEKALSKIIEGTNPPDAVFVISDLLMVGVMAAINKAGKKIPQDVSVVGFSDEPFSLMYYPQLTSVMPMGSETGIAAVQMLLDRIRESENVYEPETKVLQTKLVVRGSTK
jgi:Transcriptional regulators